MYLNSAFLKGVGRYGRPGRRDLWHPDSGNHGHGVVVVRGGDKMNERCCKHIFTGERWDFSGHQCSRKGIIEKDGKLYCKIHDPEAEQKRRKEQQEKWDAERKVENAKRRRKSAIEKACEGVPTEVLEQIKVRDLLNGSTFTAPPPEFSTEGGKNET